MSIETSLRTFLLADAGVSALVGARVYPSVIPEGGTVPALVYQRIGATPVRAMDGVGTLGGFDIQIDAYAETALGARALIEAVRVSLDCYTGTAGAHTVNGAFRGTERTGYEEDTRRFRASADYSVWSSEG